MSKSMNEERTSDGSLQLFELYHGTIRRHTMTAEGGDKWEAESEGVWRTCPPPSNHAR